MNYLRKNSGEGGKSGKRVLFAVCLVATAVVLNAAAPSFIGEKLFAIARPIWKTRDFVNGKMWGLWASIKNKERLAAENEALYRRLAEAEASLETLDYATNENNLLKAALGRAHSEKTLLAMVLSKPNHSLYDTLILDVGQNESVNVGDKVLSDEFVIGKITEVGSSYSKAVLFSSPGETTSVLIGESGIETQAAGRGSGNFSVKLPKGIKITKGDLIVMPGINPKFFGTVLTVEETDTSPFQFVLFRLPVNLAMLQWVEITK